MIGGGAMGGAIVEGIVSGVSGVDVVVVEANKELADRWRSRGDVEVAPLADAVRAADVVFLAVKPHQITDVLREAGGSLKPNCTVVSIAAGVSLELLESVAPSGTSVIRAMPNTPVRIGRGVVGLSAGAGCSPEQLEQVSALLEPVSTVVTIPESLIDALTATSGSGPAYVFYLAESMTRAAVKLGLDHETASTLVSQTLLGAAELLAQSPGDPAGFRAAVTSKGGTTAAATAVFDERDLPSIVEAAMRAASDRAEEMAREQADAAH
jgi:pyrroline-5-carboxylate reductase